VFDVALVDTSMAGIDGWSLVEMLRGIPATARIPIAMMAGVLDTVDPERIQAAPIQGFLKKPVELRELGDRITRLLETPVPFADPPPLPPLAPRAGSPFATMPATRLDDLPEFRQKQAAVAVAPPVEDDLLELMEEDLYPEREAPRAEPVAETLPEPEIVEESLDLEELDLDNLRGLAIQPEEARIEPEPPLSVQVDAGASEPTPQEAAWPIEELDAISTLDRLPAAVEPVSPAEVELPDLGAPTEELMDISTLSQLPEIEEVITEEPVSFAGLAEEPREEVSFTPPLPPLEESLDWSDDSDSMLSAVETLDAPVSLEAPVAVESLEAPTAVQSAALPEDELDLLDVSVPGLAPEPNALQLDLGEASPFLEESPAVEAPAPVLEASAVPVSALADLFAEPISPELPVVEPVPTPVEPAPIQVEAAPATTLPGAPGSREVLDAMLADPVLLDALAKAVVARLGDQVLREIAWEVIPELAERLPRN
jgi:CheY-like chemotaxis protein